MQVYGCITFFSHFIHFHTFSSKFCFPSHLQYFSHMKGFCTRSILSIEMWSFIDFRNNCSTSLYSFDDVVNMTRIYCPSGGMEDQWFGTLYIAVLFSIFLLLEESPCALQKMEKDEKTCNWKCHETKWSPFLSLPFPLHECFLKIKNPCNSLW